MNKSKKAQTTILVLFGLFLFTIFILILALMLEAKAGSISGKEILIEMETYLPDDERVPYYLVSPRLARNKYRGVGAYIPLSEPLISTELSHPSSTQPFQSLAALEVKGRDLFYQGKKIYLIGVSRREALHRRWYDFGLERYENEMIKYSLNYERIDAIRDYDKLRKHCQKMKDHGIIVELTLYDEGQGGYLADVDKVIEATADLGNIVYEPVNELYSDKDVSIAKELTRYIVRKGLLVSAGAFGAGGEEWSEKFDPIHSENQIISVHRHWDKESITRYLSSGKLIFRNEYFDRGDLALSGTRRIMEESFEAGANGVNYYGFRMRALKDLPRLDPEPYWKYLEFASVLRKKF